MAEVVNLRLARKAKRRDEKAQHAAANRAKFGEAKVSRLGRLAEEDRRVRDLDGHRREDG